MTFVCVLKTGGIYDAGHVDRLRSQIGQPVICLTDDPAVAPPTVPLDHGWPGWWSKLEVFKHDFGHTCYFDLDVIVQNLDFLGALDASRFYGMEDAYRRGTMNSSVMVWSGPRVEILSGFTLDRIAEFARGDQQWIMKHCGPWVPITPPQIVSYKKHGPCKDASVIVFHGKPKPWHPKVLSRIAAGEFEGFQEHRRTP